MPAHPLDAAFRHFLAGGSHSGPAVAAESDPTTWWPVFEAQATSRHLDFVARELQGQGLGFYTISSAGHEANALVAAALRPDRPSPAALPVGRVLSGPGPAGARFDARP